MIRILFIAACITALISNVFALEMKLNTLYLTARVDGKTATGTVSADQNSVVPIIMDGYGINYETVFLPTNNLKLEEGKVALYNTIVVEGAALTDLVQIQPQIREYQKKYNARVVYINCEPDSELGLKQNGFNLITTTNMVKVKLTPQGKELAHQYQLKGDDVVFNIENCVLRDPNVGGDCIQYHHREVAYDPSDPNITPLLSYLDYTTGQENGAIGAAIIKVNQVEEMHIWTTYIDSHIAYFLAHIWIPWSNYGMIDGYRRLLFEIQIDDYFTDNCFNKTDSCEGKREDPGVPHYRTSVQDMINLGQWHKDVTGRLPKGSNIKIELAINGIHILTETQHKITGIWDNWDVPQTTYGYVKKPGDPETHRWNQNVDTNWDDNYLTQNDPLYAYFKDPAHQDDFYWLTHTFTHLKLDAASPYDSDMEMKMNIKMSDKPYLGMYDRDCYSQHSIITPEISGLHNGDNLKAFTDNKVYFAVGDTSRADLSPANFYFPFISNKTISGFDGFVVFPRQPTQVYWDCSLIEENMAYYRERYFNTNMRDATWNDVLDFDANLHIKNFLKLRHDPYMFHEGNLRNDDFQPTTIGTATGKFGMMQQWVERMVVELNKYFDWPVKSIKMDELATVYIDRISRASCKPQYTMVIDDATGIIKEVKVESTEELKLDIAGNYYEAQCRAPLFAMRNVGFHNNNNVVVEQVGNEPPTGWIVLDKPGDSKSFYFTKEVKYADESFVGKEVAAPKLSGIGSLFSKYKLYIFIGLGVLLLLLIAFFVFSKIRGNKDKSSKSYQNSYNQPSYNQNQYNQNQYNQNQYNQNQYSQYNSPQEPPKSYTQNINQYDRNRDFMDNRSGPRARNNYQDHTKQRDYKNYRQLQD